MEKKNSIIDFARRIDWLGHDGFRIPAGSRQVVIDPYRVEADLKADILLITHPHHDHLSLEDIARLRTATTVVVTEKDSAEKLDGMEVRILGPGEECRLDDISIRAVPAYNTDKKFHPKRNNWLGFILEVEGISIYHAGDTDLIDEMEDLAADIALLPVSGTYVMTAGEAVEAARRIGPAVAIPMHFNSLVGTEEDARSFALGLEGVCEVLIPERMQ